MKVIIIDTTVGRLEIAVASSDVVKTANVLEVSNTVTSFYVDGLNVTNQQSSYGVAEYRKWKSPVSQ
jgi:hypothetical protein